MCVCVRACVCACVRACVCVCVYFSFENMIDEQKMTMHVANLSMKRSDFFLDATNLPFVHLLASTCWVASDSYGWYSGYSIIMLPEIALGSRKLSKQLSTVRMSCI